jgi:hypothetical protein
MKVVSAALILSVALNAVKGEERDLVEGERNVGGFLFTMGDCPGKCLSYNPLDLKVELSTCRTVGNDKVWELDHSCNGDKEGFFQVRHVLEGLCIEDPEDCSACNQAITLVDCDSDLAAWFSYGSLHKKSPEAYNMYSARCWLNEGIVSVLATPSLESKTCPDDFAAGACQRVEWNLDHFSKDVLYYEWSYNEVKTECDSTLFPFV